MEHDSYSPSLSYPVKSSFINYKGLIVSSELKQIKIDPSARTLLAQGRDLYGDFNLGGTFTDVNNILVNKVYDSHQILLVLSLVSNTLKGLWKSPTDSIYNPINTVEIILDLQENDLIIESDEKNENIKTKVFTNYLLDDNLSEYVGLFAGSDYSRFFEGTVYDITHVVYQYSLDNAKKKYFTGQFDLNTMTFYLKKTKLL